LDRDLTQRFYVYGRGTYEQDKFSGFDSRLFLGGGVGYKVLLGPMTTWNVEGGPGYRLDEIQLTGESVGSFSVRLGSTFAHKFNDAVTFSNDTEYVLADVSNQLINIAALTAKLTDILAARISFEVRNESNPPFGREATDTATRFSLVFGF
jgi:putative salt-induced outer membrane protein